jgi:hypothetical protein
MLLVLRKLNRVMQSFVVSRSNPRGEFGGWDGCFRVSGHAIVAGKFGPGRKSGRSGRIEEAVYKRRNVMKPFSLGGVTRSRR